MRLLAAVLAGLGERMRRTEKAGDLPVAAAAHIPSVLTGAGTVVAFGTAYAAHALYGFIGPAAAFMLLGAIGIAAMLAAALHGPALAGLGLAGALVTPLLVSSPDPDPWPVVIYLAVVAVCGLRARAAAAVAVARRRRGGRRVRVGAGAAAGTGRPPVVDVDARRRWCMS